VIPDYHGVLIPLRNRQIGQRKRNRSNKTLLGIMRAARRASQRKKATS
jgi:hypothetical protein